ncbi:MAG: hypothetical protein GY869_04160, partial [Planctomycetes bacterium]|nr:hypothetical protein [Planctomycetota bacterium]
SVLSICEDRQGKLWVGLSGNGLAYWDGNRFSSLIPPDSITIKSVQSLCEDDLGRLWIGANSGLYRYDGQQFHDYTDSLKLGNSNSPKTILDIYRDRSDRLWICCWDQGIWILEGTEFRQLPELAGLKGKLIWRVFQDRMGNFWFAADDLYKLEDGQLRVFTSKQGLAKGNARSVTEDNEGNIWIASYGGGISKLGRMLFVSYNEDDNLVEKSISAICEGDDGAYWFGTTNSGVAYGVSGAKLPGLNPRIKCIKKDKKGDIWVGTRGGGVSLVKRNIVQTTLTTYDGLLSNNINDVFIESDSTVWIATDEGLYRVNSLTLGIHRLTDLNTVTAIERDRKDRLWVGSYIGLALVKGNGYSLYTKADGLNDNYITCLEADDNGNLWIGTSSGANYYNGLTFSTPQLLASQLQGQINFILQDRQGCTWFGTTHGVFRYDIANLT